MMFHTVTAVPAAFPEQLVRSSLGQMANIGDLYDATTDRFIGQSLLTTSAAPPAVNATTIESVQEEHCICNTFYDRLALIVGEKQLGLKLSTAAGLSEPEGSIGAFVGHRDDVSLKRGVFVRTITRLHEQVENITDFEGLISSRKDSVERRSTHVVIGVKWGATVAVCLDRNDADLASGEPEISELEQHLQIMMSMSQKGVRPNSQVLSNMTNTYAVRCFSDCLSPDGHTCYTSLEDAIELLSSLPQIINSVNNGKGAPLTYTLVPLSSLAAASSWTPWCMIEDNVVTKTLAFFHEVAMSKQDLVRLFKYLTDHSSYVQERDVAKLHEFLVGFQQAEKSLLDDVASVAVALRNDQLSQSQLDDIVRSFESGEFSSYKVRSFFESYLPIIQKIDFYDDLIKQGNVIIGNPMTNLGEVTGGNDVYVLYATEAAKQQHPRLWEENCCAFFDTIKQENGKQARIAGYNSLTTFAYVDCDNVRGASKIKKIAIHRYKNGEVVCEDVAEDRAIIASLNIAESSQEQQLYLTRPSTRAVLELPCPGANKCGTSLRTWSCERCRENIEYGFDDHFYCACGKARVENFRYKCSGNKHGDEFLVYMPHVAKQHLENMKPIRELNILFLGETGVGKSTWINGFANYVSYVTLGEAEKNEEVCLIPTKFTMTNENFEEVEVKTGTDMNESQQVGRSSTQMPKSYVFKRGRVHVRIIDTPGIGDTQGIDQDRINMQNIMTHLSNYNEINGICILLKPNNARLTVMFSFCIKELLAHLHRDACKNIVFCFTNARSAFYKPGDTLPALRRLLSNNADIGLRLCRETIYCIDNESVRFLAALKQGIKFDEDEKKNYETSWETSVKETERLIDYISSLPPHRVKNMLSLNNARRQIVALSRPLAEITSTIQNNIAVVEQRRHEVMESMKHKQDLTDSLYIPAIDLQTSPLDHPRTVCTAPSCVRHISVGGVQKTDYVRHCHPHCYLGGVDTNTVNCVALQHCAAMNGTRNCQSCGCSWSVHMHITYECSQVTTHVLDTNVQQQIEAKTTSIETIKQHQQSLEQRVKELEGEKQKVASVSAKFGCFLKHNAIAPFNDAVSDYLDHLIQNEKGKVSAGGDSSALEGLENVKSMFEEEIKVLEKAINNPDTLVNVSTPEDINDLYEDLCHLQFAGPMLKKAMDVAESANAGAVQYSESRFQKCHKSQRSYRLNRPPFQLRRGIAAGFNTIGRAIHRWFY